MMIYGDLSVEAAVRVDLVCCDERETAILYIGVKRDEKAPGFRGRLRGGRQCMPMQPGWC